MNVADIPMCLVTPLLVFLVPHLRTFVGPQGGPRGGPHGGGYRGREGVYCGMRDRSEPDVYRHTDRVEQMIQTDLPLQDSMRG